MRSVPLRQARLTATFGISLLFSINALVAFSLSPSWHVPPELDAVQEFFEEDFLGVESSKSSQSTLFFVAGSRGIAAFELNSMQQNEAKKLLELLANPKCIKVGVDLAKLLDEISQHLPGELVLESWVDLSEYLWANSITSTRSGLQDLQMLKPTGSKAPVAGAAAACRDLWPRAQGLVALQGAKDGWKTSR
eukprot:Skav229353  [mRNA]  locus=scaffold3209:3405:3980:- [translate_table: standard]